MVSIKYNQTGKYVMKALIIGVAVLVLFLGIKIISQNKEEILKKNIPTYYNQPLVVAHWDSTLSITPMGGEKVKVEKDGNQFIYRNAYSKTDVIQTSYDYKLKEELVFNEPGHPIEFQYRLGNLENFIIEKDSENNLVFYDRKLANDNKELARVFSMPAPFIEGKFGRRSFKAVKLELEGDILTLKIDQNWLNNVQYPVVLDPTIEIKILNVYSHPQQGDDWQVDFTTIGTADLKIIPNDLATIEEDEFVSLACDGEMREPQILENDVIYYPDWECAGKGTVIHNTLIAGKHTLRFEFGNPADPDNFSFDFAYNDPIGNSQSKEKNLSTRPVDATYEYSTSPNMVAVDANTVYVFYIDLGNSYTVQDYRIVYKKSTDGGTTWGQPVAFPAALYGAQWQSLAIWYDKWTAGGTGTKIHIAAAEMITDDVWYIALDTATDSFTSTGWDVALAGTAYTTTSDGGVSITKTTDGRIYIAAATELGTYDVGIYYSTDGDTWTSTNFGASSFPSSGVAVGDFVQVLPVGSDDVLLIMNDVSADKVFSAVYDGSAWGDEERIDYWLESATFDGPWSAAVSTSTNDVYLVGMTGFASTTADLAAYKYASSTRNWTGLSNVATNTASTTAGTIVVDTATGNLHALYNNCLSRTELDCVVSYKKSTDDGVTWSDPSDVTFIPDDIKYIRRSMGLVGGKLYFNYFNDDTELLFTNVINTSSVGSETVIDGVIADATIEAGPSPNIVFINSTTGYVFYLDDATPYDVVYRKTTNGGASWGPKVNLTASTANVFSNVAVWYDRWSPNDTTGNLIHIAAVESTADDVWYLTIDTGNSDALDADGWVAAITGTVFDAAADGNVSFAKAYDGTLYISGCGTFGVDACRVYKSTTGQSGSWSDTSFTGVALDDLDYGQLLPARGGVMYIWHDVSTDDLRSYTYSDGAWEATKLIDGYMVDNTNFDTPWSAVFDKSTGDIFLVGMSGSAIASTTADVRGFKFASSTQTWSDSDVADPIENDPLVTTASIAMDSATGYLYAFYNKQNNAYTRLDNEQMGIYYKVSTDGGASWGSATKLNSRDNNFRNIRTNGYGTGVIYVNWYDEDFNILAGRSVIGATAPTVTKEVQNSYRVIASTYNYGTTPNIVNIDANTAYVFYVGNNTWSALDYSVVYQKTTDGGTTWSEPVVLPDQLYNNTLQNVAVWYDKWTTGNTGTKIHIAAIGSVDDDVWYTYLDTSNDTLYSLGWDKAIDTGTRYDTAADGNVSVTVAGDNTIYVMGCGTFDAVTVCRVYKSTDGDTWSNTSYNPSGGMDDEDFGQLLPISYEDILCILHDTTANAVISSVYNGSAWENEDRIDYWVVDTTYDSPWSAAVMPSSGDVFLLGMSGLASTTADLQFYQYASSTRDWTTRSNVATNTALIMESHLAIDSDNNKLFAFYSDCTSVIATDCVIRYKTSVDSGVTWSTPIEASDVPDDIKNMSSSYKAYGNKIYLNYTNDDTVWMYANVIDVSGETRGMTIEGVINDATGEYNPSPNVVFTDANTGYVFYVDNLPAAGDVVYRKTTDGGATWSVPVNLTGSTANVFNNIAVWYDRWSPNDSSGNLIHIAAVEATADEAWYSALDTSNDTQDADGWVQAIAGTTYTLGSDGPVSITKSYNGTIFLSACGAFGSSGCFVYYSTTGQAGSWTNASFAGGGSLASTDFGQLLPAKAGVMYIWQDISADLITSYIYSDAAWAQNVIPEKYILEDANYDAPWGATFNKTTGDIYLGLISGIASTTADFRALKFASSTQEWSDTAVADPVENDALITTGAMAINPNNGNLYAIYTRQNNATTRLNGQNMGIYVKMSTDGGATWDSAVKLNGFDHDIRNLKTNLISGDRLYATWFLEDWNSMFGRTIELFGASNPTPTISSVSDTPDPVTDGQPISFSVDWADPDDQIKVKICKTNSLTGQNCTDSYWATSTAFSTTDPEVVTYTAQTADIATSPNNYYAFVCDNEGVCSSSTSGTFSVSSANVAPTITSVSNTPDPVTVASNITFPVDWNDANAGDNIKAKICKTNELSGQNCTSGHWATSTAFTTSDPENLTYTAQEGDIGAQNYWAFVCDDEGACSASTSGAFTVEAASSPASTGGPGVNINGGILNIDGGTMKID